MSNFIVRHCIAGAELRYDRTLHPLLQHPLPVFLLIQAALVFFRLDLLGDWGDERFTLMTAPQPLARIAEIVQRDIHPPLYYFLLHWWIQIPWPGALLTQLRAMSAVCALLATVSFDLLWLRGVDAATRLRFLALWTFSPCLLLYSRMARSYSLQLFLAMLALYTGYRLLQNPRSRRLLAGYCGATVLLLYTHYLPGVAVAGAFSLVAIWRMARRRERALAMPLIGSNALIAIAYLPWVAAASGALGSWTSKAGLYRATSGLWSEHVLKLGYWFASFSFGEAFALWSFVAAALVAPFVIGCLWASIRLGAAWMPVVILAAIIGYLGADRWVTFPFVPGRLFFLLPFFFLMLARASRWARIVLAGLLLLDAVGIWSYFNREGYLNKAYAAPLDEMAAAVNKNSPATGTLVIIDEFNSDIYPFAARLLPGMQVMVVNSEAAAQRVRAETPASRPLVWYWRNTHDVSPGRLNTRLERELSERFDVTPHWFQKYDPLDRMIMRLLRWPDQPEYVYQLLEMHARR